ncbi:MAG TPA: T9SS type A sorting domain-containing protein [Saprospiraceae bacterium]|nr:T9SS type A sorting domain-containing protein [Saprospiraceae bacterium]
MKSIANLIFLFFAIYPLYSQNGKAIVFEEKQDNFKDRINQFETEIFLISENLEVINKNSLTNPKIINKPSAKPDLFWPLNVKEASKNNFITTWILFDETKIVLMNYLYNITTDRMNFIDSIHISEEYGQVYNSYKTSVNGKDYFILNIVGPTSTFTSKMLLIRVDENGKLKIMGQADKYLDPDPEKRSIFVTKVGIGLIAQNENRFLITGQAPIIFVIDSNFNLVKKFNPAFNRGMLDQVFFMDPRIRKESDTTFVAGDDFPLIPNFHDSYARRYLWVNDSISPLLSTQLVNPERLSKDLVNISTPRNDTYYVLSNVYDEYLTFKAPYTNKFYISKFVNDKQVSHWEYGGDYYYRVFDIEDIGDGKVMVVGSIFDFYKNGFYQGFYMIIDENGKVVSKIFETTDNDQAINLYPNPAITAITISMNNNSISKYSFEIADLSGKKRISGKLVHQKVSKIDIKDLENGTYILSILDNKNIRVHMQKITVVK